MLEVAVRKNKSALIKLGWERVQVFDHEVAAMFHSGIEDVAGGKSRKHAHSNHLHALEDP